MRAGQGKKHGRFWLGDSVINTASTRQRFFFKKKFKLCRVPDRGHSAKTFFLKKNSNFAECRPEGTRQRFFLKKIQTLPSAV